MAKPSRIECYAEVTFELVPDKTKQFGRRPDSNCKNLRLNLSSQKPGRLKQEQCEDTPSAPLGC